MKKFYLLFFIVLLFAQNAAAQTPAPELAGAKSWLNTAKPLTLAELKGKVVLLDFWTYGCINCIHIIPDLKKLEAKYPNDLVVIGVHSGKFTNERQTENIRKIILRYGLEHPVANDADFKIWEAYGVEAWPTQVLIDPNGDLALKTTGEGQLNLLDKKIGETVAEFRANGKLNETPIKFALEREKSVDTSLLFPGKVLTDAKSNRLFIADSSHNRIVVTNLVGTLLETIGNGTAGLANGDFKTASFKRPQGMALDGNTLYVADTENHAIRRVDLTTKRVETIGGTGEQGGYNDGGVADKTALNSPWDLQLVERELFVAMAGTHQIWRMDLEKGTVAPFAGSGREARTDGNLQDSAFAQPSGLAFDGKLLYVADAESNVIRAIDLAKQTVVTLAGGDLFDFGDKDGTGDDVRFQHPLGIATWGKNLIITDTYNHKVKTLNPLTRVASTVFGDGKPGKTDGAKAEFYEPGGLSIVGSKLYIADTNNHVIRVINLLTKQIKTLEIKGLSAFTGQK
jgi:thiol-disulfide isomerase/thioredoxin